MIHYDEDLDVIFSYCLCPCSKLKLTIIFNISEIITFDYWYGLQPWASFQVGKFSPGSILAEVSPVCSGGWWHSAEPTWGRKSSNHKPYCRKGRWAQAAGVRGAQEDYGKLQSPLSPSSRRQGVSLTKELVFWCHQSSSPCMLAKTEDWFLKTEATTHQGYQNNEHLHSFQFRMERKDTFYQTNPTFQEV